MEAQEKILNEHIYFLYVKLPFFWTRSELKNHQNFHEGSYDTLLFLLQTDFYCIHNFCKINSLQESVQKPKAAAKD